MKKIQIQLPEPLYNETKTLAQSLGISVAEICRRGAEYIASTHRHVLEASRQKWQLPEAKQLGAAKTSHEDWREIANERD